MDIVVSILVLGLIVALAILKSKGSNTSTVNTPAEIEGVKRAGRVGLWVMFPPLGLWRSVRHGQRKRDERLAQLIEKERSRYMK